MSLLLCSLMSNHQVAYVSPGQYYSYWICYEVMVSVGLPVWVGLQISMSLVMSPPPSLHQIVCLQRTFRNTKQFASAYKHLVLSQFMFLSLGFFVAKVANSRKYSKRYWHNISDKSRLRKFRTLYRAYTEVSKFHITCYLHEFMVPQ